MPAQKPDRKTAWKQSKRHEATLPSGTVVEVEIPNLPALMKAGQIPNDLIDAALATVNEQTAPDRESLNQQVEFENVLVSLTVKDPEITPEEVIDLPYEDVELIVAIATRNRDIDAIGRQLGGLDRKEEWRTFRGLPGRE